MECCPHTNIPSTLALGSSQSNGLHASQYKSAFVDVLKVKEMAFYCTVVLHLILVNRFGSTVLQSVGE